MVPMIYVARNAGWPEFVDFWSSWYAGYDEDETIPDAVFLKHLKWPSGRLTSADIELLFEWKNGMPLSGKKKVVTRYVKAKLQDLNHLREAGPEDIFPLAAECSQSTVWRRFICYIVSPYQCPIWDKNVLRAFQLLTDRPEHPEAREDEKAYDAYRTFYLDLVPHIRSKVGIPAFRRVDQALFAFGAHYFPVLSP